MTAIDVSKIKAGDTVTAKITGQGQQGDFEVTGTVWGGDPLCVGDRSIEASWMVVTDHKPLWREPEGWQEWDGVSIDGQHWMRDRDSFRDWWPIFGSQTSVVSVGAVRAAMQGREVKRLWITEQEPA